MKASDDTAYRIIVGTSASLVVSVVSVFLRLICRRWKHVGILSDDYLILSALIFTITLSITSLLLVGAGLGTHIDTLSSVKVVAFRQLLYAIRFLYAPAVTFAKLSILFLYRRILPVKQIFLSTSTLSGILITWCCAIFCLDLLKCLPIAKAWEPALPGHCIARNDYAYSLQIPSIAIDVAIILIPAKVVWDCALKLPQKFMASSIFMVGLITLAGDITKLTVMLRSSNDSDITYNQVDLLLWTNVQPALAILSACLPVMKPFFQHSQQGRSIKSSATNSAIRLDIEGNSVLPTPFESSDTPSSPNKNQRVQFELQKALPVACAEEWRLYHTRNPSKSGSFMDL